MKVLLFKNLNHDAPVLLRHEVRDAPVLLRHEVREYQLSVGDQGLPDGWFDLVTCCGHRGSVEVVVLVGDAYGRGVRSAFDWGIPVVEDCARCAEMCA